MFSYAIKGHTDYRKHPCGACQKFLTWPFSASSHHLCEHTELHFYHCIRAYFCPKIGGTEWIHSKWYKMNKVGVLVSLSSLWQISENNNSREERLILAHGFRGFRTWPAGSIAFHGGRAWQGKRCSPHGSQGTQRDRQEGARAKYMPQGHLWGHWIVLPMFRSPHLSTQLWKRSLSHTRNGKCASVVSWCFSIQSNHQDWPSLGQTFRNHSYHVKSVSYLNQPFLHVYIQIKFNWSDSLKLSKVGPLATMCLKKGDGREHF
jgi:hypothetical protein